MWVLCGHTSQLNTYISVVYYNACNLEWTPKRSMCYNESGQCAQIYSLINLGLKVNTKFGTWAYICDPLKK